METKVCSKCSQEKEICEFRKRKDSKDGLRTECKECSYLVWVKYRDINSEKITNTISDNYENINYIYNEQYKTTNQAHSIKIYLEQYDNCEKLLIVSNGVLFKDKCITKNMLTNECKVFILNKTRENFNLGCSEQQHFEYLFYDLPELWSECIYLNKEALTVLRNLFTSNYTTQMYLFELINEMINKNILFKKQYIDKKLIMKICNFKDMAKAKNFI
jgi:hypothetical protein